MTPQIKRPKRKRAAFAQYQEAVAQRRHVRRRRVHRRLTRAMHQRVRRR